MGSIAVNKDKDTVEAFGFSQITRLDDGKKLAQFRAEMMAAKAKCGKAEVDEVIIVDGPHYSYPDSDRVKVSITARVRCRYIKPGEDDK